jgi:hypothetical protein
MRSEKAGDERKEHDTVKEGGKKEEK